MHVRKCFVAIYLKYLKLELTVSFENLFLEFPTRYILYKKKLIWTLIWRNLLSPLVKKKQTRNCCFHWNIRLNVPLNLKKIAQ